jgi:hypothetical protein
MSVKEFLHKFALTRYPFVQSCDHGTSNMATAHQAYPILQRFGHDVQRR